MNPISTYTTLAILCSTSLICSGDTITEVPMTLKGSKTFYVSARIAGIGPTEFMVDTGSSYLTINQATLSKLQSNGKADYLRDLVGIMANGDELVMPVYRIPRIVLGNNCELYDLEAVVFPGQTRQLLGLSVLRKAAPFMFSIDPPGLQLSNCGLVSASAGP
jgi:predicted aspartyl protease